MFTMILEIFWGASSEFDLPFVCLFNERTRWLTVMNGNDMIFFVAFRALYLVLVHCLNTEFVMAKVIFIIQG
jgi:hypothetical protein